MDPPRIIPRASGVLLHLTSLPGPYGIGDLGPQAHRWIDTLARAGQSWWQILPLGPSGAGNSPYQSFSAFAGNPLLISPDLLLRDGLLRRSDLTQPDFPSGRVAFNTVKSFKWTLLNLAWRRFTAGGAKELRQPLREFVRKEGSWLPDYALFMALRQALRGTPCGQWPSDLVRRKPQALADAKRALDDAIGREQFIQFLFHRQLQALRAHARQKKVGLIGDLPIFVSPDSADVWANPHLFLLDRDRRPRFVAGVPPDYFSKTGQLWGNPLYNWSAMEREGFSWWISRIQSMLNQVDLIRIDHFRGFDAYWRIPASAKTAQTGHWVKAPGSKLFLTLQNKLGCLPFIAEDLGEITPSVERLRDRFSLPGMRVLQFAFGSGPQNPFLPHNHVRNSIVYTGTHDNDTTAGWFKTLSKSERARVRRYVPHADQKNIHWELIRLAWMSVADLAIAPIQDVLGLGTSARMNVPGKATGNWGWRLKQLELHPQAMENLAELTQATGRGPS
jgi:4-alpha-glucanotransferase